MPPRDPGEWSVLCDVCQGRRFVQGMICAKCAGIGRILIAERDRRTTRLWRWLKRRLGIEAWQERRRRDRRDSARLNMGKYGRFKP